MATGHAAGTHIVTAARHRTPASRNTMGVCHDLERTASACVIAPTPTALRPSGLLRCPRSWSYRSGVGRQAPLARAGNRRLFERPGLLSARALWRVEEDWMRGPFPNRHPQRATTGR